MAEKKLSYEELMDSAGECLSGESLDFISEWYMPYRTDYLSDLFGLRADASIDIYDADLYEWAEEHIRDVEYAIDEFGWEGCGKTLRGAIQMAQYMVRNDLLFAEENDIKTVWACKLAKDIADVEGIDINSIDFEDFENDVGVDGHDKLGRLEEDIRDWLIEKSGKEVE